MSKPPNSASRSRSRSRSRSYTRSHSRSRSRSRSRKRRYSSRSRSRSHSRERTYPSRDFQGNRGFNRGYRGYRRPFQYNRGRGRGYFPRGNYHRGGGPYGFRNNNNWHGHRDQQQPYDHSYSPRRGRSRSHSPRKRSGSRSRSRHSDRSSSGHSRRSSSSSRSSSPRRRSSGRPPSKDAKGRGSSGEGKAPTKEASKPRGSPPEESTSKWECLSDYDRSPKRSDSAASGGGQPEIKVTTSGGAGNGGSLWRSIGPASKSPPPKTSTSPGFGFFSKDDLKAGDKSASISTAFKKFLAEKKKPMSDRDNGRGEALSSAAGDNEKTASKSRGVFEASDSGYDGSKTDKVLPFLDAEEEEYRQEMKDRKNEEESKYKDKIPLSVRNLAEERFGKWDDSTYHSSKDSSRRDEEVEEELDEELYRSRKHARKEEKAAKKKEKKKSRISPSSPSPSRAPENKGKLLFPAARERSSSPKSSAKKEPLFNFSIKAFTDDGESSSGALAKERRLSRDLLHPTKKEKEKDHEKFRSIFEHVQSAQLRRSPSELFAQHIVTIVHHIKAQHFQSSGMSLNERFGIYQRKAAEMESMKNPRKSPEIHRRIDVSPSAFKKHSHLFEDFEESGYKDHGKKHDADSLDLRLAIERRKKDPKRDGGKSSAGSRTPSHELSPERSSKQKKSKKSKKKRERSPSSSSSSSSSPSPRPYRGREYFMEDHMEGGGGFNKARLGSREFHGSRDYEGHMDRGYERGRGGYDRGGYDRGRGGYERGFPRMRGRGWNRGNYPVNNTSNNPQNMAGPSRPQEEEWDPEYTPKSRKYFQHDDRDKEAEMKWADTRGRGRGGFPRARGAFIVRKSSGSPKWAHDMFPGNTDGGDMGDGSADHSLKDDDKSGGSPASKP